MSNDGCPCGTGRPYPNCCEPIHRTGAGLGISAEQLMRARYTAYVYRDHDFLADSWHPDTRPPSIEPEPDLVWLGLTVIDTTDGTGLDTDGTVTFEARYQGPGGPGVLQEQSRFTRIDGRWVYVDGS